MYKFMNYYLDSASKRHLFVD